MEIGIWKTYSNPLRKTFSFRSSSHPSTFHHFEENTDAEPLIFATLKDSSYIPVAISPSTLAQEDPILATLSWEKACYLP